MTVRVWLEVVGDDDPRACSGRRLLRLGRAVEVPSVEGRSPTPIVLDPYARTALSRADRAASRRGGVAAVDCSWNRLARVGGFGAGGERGRRSLHRRLPLLLAGNPQHFGRLGELNTVEALAAALFVLGEREAAGRLLAGFAGGREFLSMNHDRFSAYAAAEDADGIRAAERRLFGPPETPAPT